MPPIVFSIAGSDCSGGAGIQADIKTISALGGYAAAAVTSVTVQNTLGVQGVSPVPADVVGAQIAAVMSDLHPGAVKIGMIPDADCVVAIAEALAPYADVPIVCDPVMISTSGRRLMSEQAVERLCAQLFPQCALITPNLPEAEALMGCALTDVPAMHRAARALSARWGCSVLIKGGHLDSGDMCDVLAMAEGEEFEYHSPRVETTNLHGTGCTLSSAIATWLARGVDLPQAVGRGKEYVAEAISRGRHLHVGQGNGPLGHFEI